MHLEFLAAKYFEFQLYHFGLLGTLCIPSDNGRNQYKFNPYFLTVIYLFIDCMYVFFIIMF